MQKKKGSVFGGALLITGSCIGAGMLGLPVVTGISGFLPSFIMFFIAWLFMTTTSLLMVEVLGWFKRPVNLISMVSHTLGPIGKLFCWVLYLFLFYALLVAYIILSGDHTSIFFQYVFSFSLPDWIGSLFFVCIFGFLIYLGTRPVDHINRFLMIGKIIAYLILVLASFHFISSKLLLYWKPKYALLSFPILIISFGFQNMIPSLMRYMGGDRFRVRKSILIGSLFTFFLYLTWEFIALGILPSKVILHSYHADTDAAVALHHFLRSEVIGDTALVFAFFAILTSFLAQSLSVVHFLSDGLKIKHKNRENIWICLLALVPPLLFSLLFPNVFFKALNFAGGFCAVVLFGVLPALMVWIGRYQKGENIPDKVPGGRPVLVAILLVASFIFFYQISHMLGFAIFPHPK